MDNLMKTVESTGELEKHLEEAAAHHKS